MHATHPLHSGMLWETSTFSQLSFAMFHSEQKKKTSLSSEKEMSALPHWGALFLPQHFGFALLDQLIQKWRAGMTMQAGSKGFCLGGALRQGQFNTKRLHTSILPFFHSSWKPCYKTKSSSLTALPLATIHYHLHSFNKMGRDCSLPMQTSHCS